MWWHANVLVGLGVPALQFLYKTNTVEQLAQSGNQTEIWGQRPDTI
jgi:hypothetical protein